jgi:hypothetical protein
MCVTATILSRALFNYVFFGAFQVIAAFLLFATWRLLKLAEKKKKKKVLPPSNFSLPFPVLLLLYIYFSTHSKSSLPSQATPPLFYNKILLLLFFKYLFCFFPPFFFNFIFFELVTFNYGILHHHQGLLQSTLLRQTMKIIYIF